MKSLWMETESDYFETNVPFIYLGSRASRKRACPEALSEDPTSGNPQRSKKGPWAKLIPGTAHSQPLSAPRVPPHTSGCSILGSGDSLGERSALGSAGLGLQPVGELRRVVPAALLVACEREGMCEASPGEREDPAWGERWTQRL